MFNWIPLKRVVSILAIPLFFLLICPSTTIAQQLNDCGEDKDAAGLVQNDTTFTLQLVVCHNFPDSMGSGLSKDTVEIDAIWAIRPSDNSISPYKIGKTTEYFTSGSMRVWRSPDTPRGYVLLSGSSICYPTDGCGWKTPDHKGWPKPGQDPQYRIIVYDVSHNLFRTQEKPQNFYTNCNDLDYSGVVLFSSDSCKGQYRDYNYAVSVLGQSGFIPSSMLVASGWSALVADGAGNYRCLSHSHFDLDFDTYPGTSKRLQGNVLALDIFHDSTCGVNDQNQDGSIDNPSIGPAPQPGVTPEPPPESNPQNPSGRLITYTEKEYVGPYNELEVGGWDVENREYRSISIPAGWSFVLQDTGGHQSCFNQSLHNLTDHEEWQFHIDIIHVFSYNICLPNDSNPPPEPLGDSFSRFWSNPGFSGSSVTWSFVGGESLYFWIPSLRVSGLDFNDTFESMELNPTRSVAVYEHDNLQGGGKCFYGSDSDFRNDQFDNGVAVANQVSSFRHFLGPTCTLNPLTPQDIWIHEIQKGKVTITWPLSSPNADGFYVYRIDQYGNTTRIASLSNAEAIRNAQALGLSEFVRAWTFTEVSCGQQYTFAVSAFAGQGESDRTRAVSSYTPQCDCNDPSFNGVGLYDLSLCQGDFSQLTIPGWYILSDFNDRTSSIFVKPGWSVEVFEGSNNTDGQTICFNESKWDLSYDSYWLETKPVEGTLSAVRVWDKPNCGRTLPISGCDTVNSNDVTLFDYTHCLGLDKSYSTPGFYALDTFDDLTSSIFVPPGKSVRVYENSSREGVFLCIRETKWDLKYDPYWIDASKNAFNNISAIEVFNDSLCGGISAPSIVYPTSAYTMTDADNLTFVWENIYAGSYWVELWGPNGYFKSSGPLNRNEWDAGSLAPGDYVWNVVAEVHAVVGPASEASFTVLDNTSVGNPQVNYNLDPIVVNKVTFSVTNCVGIWVHVAFGDGEETDSPCVGGISTTEHDYAYSGSAVVYNAIVAGIPVIVSLPGQKDCGELKPTAGVSLFTEINCQGNKLELATTGNKELGIFNDVASAILVAPNWSVEVFENSSSADGHSYCVTRDIWDLSFESYYATQELKLDKTISNIRVYNNSTCGKQFPQYGGCDANIDYDGVVLFDYIHCGGAEQAFGQPGRFELGYGEPFNDLATSVHVGAGWSILAYENSGWTGRSSCFAQDMWDLGIDVYWQTQSFVNNTISSVEVFHNSQCTPTGQPVSPLLVPTNLLPSGVLNKTIASAVVAFRWNAVQGATKYQLELTEPGQATVVFTLETNGMIRTITADGAYTWRVRAVNDAGATSSWSSQSFSLATATFDKNIYLPRISR